MRLHVFPASPRSFKVLSFVAQLGLEFETRIVDLTKGEQNTPEFAALNPNKRVPVLEDDGFVLWESNAILQYLALKKPERGFLPADPRLRAEVARWQCWDLAHWDPACATILFERLVKGLLNLGAPDLAEIAKGEERFHRCAAVLDGQLKGRRFVTGDTLTVADFSIGPSLNLTEAAQLPVGGYKEIKRWHADLCELPAWRKTLAASRPH